MYYRKKKDEARAIEFLRHRAGGQWYWRYGYAFHNNHYARLSHNSGDKRELKRLSDKRIRMKTRWYIQHEEWDALGKERKSEGGDAWELY